MKLDFTRQIESNGTEFLLTMGRASGSEEKNTEHIRWIIGGSPIGYHNAVVMATLPKDTVEMQVKASIDCMQKYGVPGTWHVGPSMTPRNISDSLIQYGFIYVGDDIGMAVEIDGLPEKVNTPPGFSIIQIQDASQLEIWRDTLGQGFGEGPKEARWVTDIFAQLGYTGDTPWWHYLGYFDGQPVGTSTLFLDSSAAGVYFVTTVPQARRRGIGAAMTLFPLHEARKLGYWIGVLGASEMGYPVYRRLGFREFCRIQIFEYHS